MYSLQMSVCFFQDPERINMQNSTIICFHHVETLKHNLFTWKNKPQKCHKCVFLTPFACRGFGVIFFIAKFEEL